MLQIGRKDGLSHQIHTKSRILGLYHNDIFAADLIWIEVTVSRRNKPTRTIQNNQPVK